MGQHLLDECFWTMKLQPDSQQHHWGCGSDSLAEMPDNSDLLFCSGSCHLPGANSGSRPCSVHTLCWDHYTVTPPPLVTFLPLKLSIECTHSFCLFICFCLKETIWCLLVFKAMEFSGRRILQQVKNKNTLWEVKVAELFPGTPSEADFIK